MFVQALYSGVFINPCFLIVSIFRQPQLVVWSFWRFPALILQVFPHSQRHSQRDLPRYLTAVSRLNFKPCKSLTTISLYHLITPCFLPWFGVDIEIFHPA